MMLFMSLGEKMYGTTGTFWTNAIPYILPEGKMQLPLVNYFTIFKNTTSPRSLPPQVGLYYGAFSKSIIKSEIGIDYFGGIDYPYLFSWKAGFDENSVRKGFPSFNFGMFGIGTKKNVNDFNIMDFVIGKTVFNVNIFGGAYYGSKTLSPDRAGWWGGFIYLFYPVKDCKGQEYKKFGILADYASGKNVIGGGGFSFTWFVTPDIYFQTGPVWFNDVKINGRWKFGISIVINSQIIERKDVKTHTEANSI
jgi:hypothetical protein